MILLPYTPEQSQQAYDEWKAMCGHHSIAAATHASLDRVKQACPKLVGWMNPTMIGTTLHNLGARTKCLTRLPDDTRFLFTPGRRVMRIQFEGSWTGPGVPPAAAYKHTHYIAVIDELVMDPMVDSNMLISLLDWLETEQYRVLQDVPKATGWHFTHCWEVKPLTQGKAR